MYYLQSRYYNPTVGRFINGDVAVIIDGSANCIDCNLYQYCNNNAPNHSDIYGYFVITIAAGVTISIGTTIALIALTVFILAYLLDKNFRNAVNQLILLLIQGVIDGVGYLANVLYDVASKAKKGRKYNGNEVHHIVAQSDYRAKLSINYSNTIV